MGGARLLRIVARLEAGADPAPVPARLCEGCAEIMAMTGAGVMLMSGDVPRGSICSSNSVSNMIEELQYTLGEGPSVDAYEHNQAVLEPDLAAAGVGRWGATRDAGRGAGRRLGLPLRRPPGLGHGLGPARSERRRGPRPPTGLRL